MKKILAITAAMMMAQMMQAQTETPDTTVWKDLDLGEITVKGQRPKTKLKGNSMVTTIKGSALEKSGTAEDMLAKVPGMKRGSDGLEVIGKGTPVFYINGRKMNDKDELKRLRSEEIHDVEVITNPGAQYDATVTAVVRIKTVKREGEGFGYDLTAANNQELHFGHSDPSATVNLRYRYNNLDFFGMANYWKWDSTQDSKPCQDSYMLGEGQLLNINQNSRLVNHWKGEGFNYNLGFNWQIANDQFVGMRIEMHDRINGGTETDIYTLTKYFADGVKTMEDNTTSHLSNKETQPYSWEGNAYYNGKAGKMGIDLNVDFVTNKLEEVNDINEMTEGQPLVGKTVTPTTSRMEAAKLVLSYPVWKGMLQFGTEMSFVHRNQKYTVEGINVTSTDTKAREDNEAAFAEYSFSIPKVGMFNAGLRFEHVGFKYEDRLNPDQSMTRYTDDLFPSFSWANQFGAWQVAASYSNKTSRPSYWMLNGAMQYLNPYTRQQGDPTLKNEKIHEVGISLRWKWITLQTSYERRENTLTQWSFLYDDYKASPSRTAGNDMGGNAQPSYGSGIILIKNINQEEPVRNFAQFLSVSPTWGCYSPNWTLGWQKFFTEYDLADPREATGQRTVRYNKPLVFADFNNTFRLKHSWQFECNVNYIRPGDVTNFRLVNHRVALNLVAQKCWLKNDALCLRVTLNDVLRKNYEHVTMDCGYYTLEQKNIQDRHRLDVSLRYTFNASKSKYKGTGAGKDAHSRMENK